MKRALSVSAGGSSGGGRSVSGGTASTARSSTAGDGGPQQPLKGDPSDGPASGFGSGEAPGADDPVVSLSFRSPLAAKSEGTGAAPPALGNLDPFDPRLHLAALKNEQSAFGAVSRSCLALNQWAGGGVGSAFDDGGMDLCNKVPTPRICSSVLLCPSQHAVTAGPALRALQQCAADHTDRRCRILGLQTLALVARSVYARTREGEAGLETLTQHDGGAAARVEDEVVNDVAVALLTAATDEDDDGVSAAALEAAGALVLASGSAPGGAALAGRFDGGYDGLAAEIRSLVTSDPRWAGTGNPSALAGSGGVANLSPETTALRDLSSRVYSSIAPPRIRRILHRIGLYGPAPPSAAVSGTGYVERALPFVTGALCYMAKTERRNAMGIDGAGYAKRWTEMDIRGLAGEAVDRLMLPILTDGWSFGMDGKGSSGAGIAVSLSALRLVQACPDAAWTDDVCRAVMGTMSDVIRSAGGNNVEPAVLAVMLISLRGLTPRERRDALSLTFDTAIKFLPSLEVAPSTVGSAGLPLPDGSVRRPVRLGILVEVALLALLPNSTDGDDEVNGSIDIRSDLIFAALRSSSVQAMLSSRTVQTEEGTNESKRDEAGGEQSGQARQELFEATSAADETVLVFCAVAHLVGKVLLASFYQEDVLYGSNARTQSKPEDGSYVCLQSWIRASLAVLYETSCCLSWTDPIENGTNVPTTSISMAARGAYLKLLSHCLACTDLIHASSSVAANMLPISYGGEVDDGFKRLAASSPLRHDMSAVGSLSDLMGWIVETKLKGGIPNYEVRISLLVLLSDYWVQTCRLALSPISETEEVPIELNETYGREILSLLANEISMLIDRQEDYAIIRGGECTHQLFLCVACVENMALAADAWSQRYGVQGPQGTQEYSSFISSISTAILNGQGKNTDEVSDIELDPSSLAAMRQYMIDQCLCAARRIETAIQRVDTNGNSHGESSVPIIFSPLVESEQGSGLTKSKGGVHITRPQPWWTSSVTLLSRKPLPFLSGSSAKEMPKGNQRQVIDNAFEYGYLYELYRQVILSRTDYAVRSLQLRCLGSSDRLTRPSDLLRLSIPSQLQGPGDSGLKLMGSQWDGSGTDVSGSSDPIAFTVYFADRICPRYDGEAERRLVIVIKVHNVTAVPIAGGVRLGLTIEASDDVANSIPLSAAAYYRHEIKAGDHITWTVQIHEWRLGGGRLYASIAFLDLEAEASTLHWARKNVVHVFGEHAKSKDEQLIVTEGDKDDDFSVGQVGIDGVSLGPSEAGEGFDDIVDICLFGDPIIVPSSIVLQPCPLVFFQNSTGDAMSFMYLWFTMPYCAPKIKLHPRGQESFENSHHMDFGKGGFETAIHSKLSSSIFTDDVERWAFSTWCSKTTLCVMVRDEEGGGSLFVKGDDGAFIASLLDVSDKNSFVRILTSGTMIP